MRAYDDPNIRWPKDYDSSSWTSRFMYTKSRKVFIKLAMKVLKPIKDKFDSIAFTGISGALIAPALADKLNKELILVRKVGDKDGGASGYIPCKNYIIVDDFIDTGTTVQRVAAEIKNWHKGMKCIGVLEVQSLESHRPESMTLTPLPKPPKKKRKKRLVKGR